MAFHRPVAIVEPTRGGSREDIEKVLHEEIDRLPRPYRSAVVVCYLEGMSQAQAARQLHLAESTVRGRLARARRMLRQRLTRRGVTLTTGLLGLGTTANLSALPLPSVTAQATAHAALLFVKQGEAISGAVSVTAQNIANGVLSIMWFNSLKALTVMVMAVGLLVGGAALLAQPMVNERHPDKSSRVAHPPEIAVAVLQVGQDGGLKPSRTEQGRGQAQAQKREESLAIEPDLAKLAPGRIVWATPVSKDCMILAYLPDWNHGNVDNIGIGNNGGGVRTLINWPVIPPDEAASSERQFLIALYSRKTISHPPAGKIHAFEILQEWPERTSWKTQPKYDVEPAAAYRFEPGKGWKLFDITPLVHARAKGGRNGYGIMLRFLNEDFAAGPEEVFSDYKMVSREGADEWANRRPLLLVVKASQR